MKIGSLSENHSVEKRVAITPEIIKKYLSLGFEILLEENYASHLGIEDKEYSDLGVKFSNDKKEILKNSDIVVQLGILPDEEISILKENKIVIGVLNPYDNKDKLESLAKKKNKCLFFRTSSKNYQSTIYGYIVFSSKFSRVQGSN